jgi:hypothetical protein
MAFTPWPGARKHKPERFDRFAQAFREAIMTRLAALLWIMGGTVLAGVAVLVVLLTPSLQGEALRVIPIAAVVGYAVGIPLALVAARAITQRAG